MRTARVVDAPPVVLAAAVEEADAIVANAVAALVDANRQQLRADVVPLVLNGASTGIVGADYDILRTDRAERRRHLGARRVDLEHLDAARDRGLAARLAEHARTHLVLRERRRRHPLTAAIRTVGRGDGELQNRTGWVARVAVFHEEVGARTQEDLVDLGGAVSGDPREVRLDGERAAMRTGHVCARASLERDDVQQKPRSVDSGTVVAVVAVLPVGGWRGEHGERQKRE